MEMDMQMTDVDYIPGVEYDHFGQPVGITVEEWMDRLDKRLIDHYGDDFRNRVNASRKRWNEKGRWHFDMLDGRQPYTIKAAEAKAPPQHFDFAQ